MVNSNNNNDNNNSNNSNDNNISNNNNNNNGGEKLAFQSNSSNISTEVDSSSAIATPSKPVIIEVVGKTQASITITPIVTTSSTTPVKCHLLHKKTVLDDIYSLPEVKHTPVDLEKSISREKVVHWHSFDSSDVITEFLDSNSYSIGHRVSSPANKVQKNVVSSPRGMNIIFYSSM